MSAEWWNKFKHFVGIPVDEELEHFEEEGGNVAVLEEPPPPSRASNSGKSLNNMVGFSSTLTQSEVMIIEPKSFEDALEMVQSLRDRRAVIMNMKALDAEKSQRLLDFVSGATHALEGHQKQIGEGIFLFSPSNVAINPLGAEQPWLNRDASDLFWRVK